MPAEIIKLPNASAHPIWPRGALNMNQAAHYLSIGRTQLWKLTAVGKIRRTSYGTYPVEELDRHLRQEMENA